MEYLCDTPLDLNEQAPEMVEELGTFRIVLLRGDLGAGKTAFVQALCAAMGIPDLVTSPTFSLVNQYVGPDDLNAYHVDLYRLHTLDEALQIGIEEYLDTDAWCFIEWPELILPILEPPYITVDIEINPDASRKIRILKVHAHETT